MVALFSHLTTVRIKTIRHIVHMSILFGSSLFLVYPVNVQAALGSGYSLIGTIVSGSFAGAVIADATGAQSFYRLNEKLPEGQQIVAVRGDSISLNGTNGSEYTMYIAHDMKTAASVASAGPRFNAMRPAWSPSALYNGMNQGDVR